MFVADERQHMISNYETSGTYKTLAQKVLQHALQYVLFVMAICEEMGVSNQILQALAGGG